MTEELDRRDWMRLVAVLSVAAPTVAQAPAPASQQGQRPNVPQRVSKENLHQALQQAAKADDEIKRGHYRGPLHGIPWGAKDLYATKGIKTTWGAEPYQNQVFDYNATVVDRLEQQGAVLLAKLSMGALAQGGLWFAGMTKNPWNTERTSSGSSAGSAASTSAGLVGFSLGTETLGSIISPSTTCGVVGLAPTYGRCSPYRRIGLSWTMDKPGPILRTAAGCP